MSALDGNGDSGTGGDTTPPPNPANQGTGGNNDGWTRQEWANGLDVEDEILRSNMFTSVKNVSDVVKGYYHAQKLVGADKIAVPNEKSSPEQWRAYYEKVGLPSKLEDYNTDIPATYNDDSFKKELFKAAHDSFIKPDQLKNILGVVDKYNEKLASSVDEDDKRAMETTVNNLKAAWGSEMDRNISVIKDTIKHLGGDDTFKAIMDSPLADNETFIKFMFDISKKLNKEDTFGKDIVRKYNMSKEDAQSRLNEIMGDKNSPYFQSNHPQKNDFMTEVLKLQEILAKV